MGFWDVVKKGIDVVDVLSGGPAKRAQAQKSFLNHSVSCRKCGGLAGPIAGTKRNYRCDCGHQFSGANHPY